MVHSSSADSDCWILLFDVEGCLMWRYIHQRFTQVVCKGGVDYLWEIFSTSFYVDDLFQHFL
uniref:Uncharacterized protein n=1 Tax=Arion vulgaris TaxID=1028688 RepID=A0A0B7ATR8_9EUPU